MNKLQTKFSIILLASYASLISLGVSAMEVQFNESIEDNILTIKPSASCDCEDTFIYKLSSTKSSASGVSSSSQSGRFHLEPNQTSYLSQLSFNLENDTQYELHLIITDFNGNTIAEDILKRP